MNPQQNQSAPIDLNMESNNHVPIKFGQLLPMLHEAIMARKTWVQDFEDEEIKVSADLFDVIQASKYFR